MSHYPALRIAWTGDRIARLGFLIGLGWEARRIAEDPLIASTANNVHRQAQRFGLAFRDVPAAPTKLPAHVGAHFDRAAARRSLTRESLIRLLLIVTADDPGLLDNILDDGA